MRVSVARGIAICFACTALLALSAAPAQAARTLLTQNAVEPDLKKTPGGQIEGACGVAVGPGGSIYVSDYYHGVVDVFKSNGDFEGASNVPATPPEGPCGLAFSSTGALYANIWHQRVVRLGPSVLTLDTDNATGVSVDPTTDLVYVDERTHVSVFDSAGNHVLDGSDPLRIGEGTLGDGFGVAAFEGRIYVPDASNDTIKVYEPSTSAVTPVLTITGSATPQKGFASLVDASVAVDPTTENLLVVDNLKPGFVKPEAAVYEFDSTGAYLGRLPGAPVHGEPSGIAVDPSTGRLLVTTGNSEDSNVFAYGPYAPGGGSGSEGGEGPPTAPLQGLITGQAGSSAAGPASFGGRGEAPRSSSATRRSHKKVKRVRGRIGVSIGFAVRGRSRSND